MKRVCLLCLCLAMAWVCFPDRPATATVVDVSLMTAGTCEKPSNYKDCAAECDNLADCKRCCARGRFSDKFYKRCNDQCKSTHGMVVREDELDEAEGFSLPGSPCDWSRSR